MNYDDIKDMSNAEAVAFYGPLTVTPIQSGDLENLIDWYNLANRDAVTGAWQGSLIDVLQNSPVPAIRDGLSELFSHLNKPHSKTIDTTVQPWASKMEDLFGGLVMIGQANVAFKADVVALAGGYADADLTEADVQKLRDDNDAWLQIEAAGARQSDYNARFNQHVSPVLGDPASSDADVKAAIEVLAATYGA